MHGLRRLDELCSLLPARPWNMLFEAGKTTRLGRSMVAGLLRFFDFSGQEVDAEFSTKARKSFLSSSISLTFCSRFFVRKLTLPFAYSASLRLSLFWVSLFISPSTSPFLSNNSKVKAISNELENFIFYKYLFVIHYWYYKTYIPVSTFLLRNTLTVFRCLISLLGRRSWALALRRGLLSVLLKTWFLLAFFTCGSSFGMVINTLGLYLIGQILVFFTEEFR